jgi:hypothetical protein
MLTVLQSIIMQIDLTAITPKNQLKKKKKMNKLFPNNGEIFTEV